MTLLLTSFTFLYNLFCQALDADNEMRVVFCDINKTFDRVWHAGLLRKLEAADVSGNLLAWFKLTYLIGNIVLYFLEFSSDWSKILADVPQGSILGPFLFLVFINDIVNEIGSCIRLFADDPSLFIIAYDPVSSAKQLNADIVKILQRTETWLVTFNPSKTESLIISRKSNRPLHPSLFIINHQQITEVACHKH